VYIEEGDRHTFLVNAKHGRSFALAAFEEHKPANLDVLQLR
jgi:hypothetical protein